MAEKNDNNNASNEVERKLSLYDFIDHIYSELDDYCKKYNQKYKPRIAISPDDIYGGKRDDETYPDGFVRLKKHISKCINLYKDNYHHLKDYQINLLEFYQNSKKEPDPKMFFNSLEKKMIENIKMGFGLDNCESMLPKNPSEITNLSTITPDFEKIAEDNYNQAKAKGHSDVKYEYTPYWPDVFNNVLSEFKNNSFTSKIIDFYLNKFSQTVSLNDSQKIIDFIVKEEVEYQFEKHLKFLYGLFWKWYKYAKYSALDNYRQQTGYYQTGNEQKQKKKPIIISIETVEKVNEYINNLSKDSDGTFFFKLYLRRHFSTSYFLGIFNKALYLSVFFLFLEIDEASRIIFTKKIKNEKAEDIVNFLNDNGYRNSKGNLFKIESVNTLYNRLRVPDSSNNNGLLLQIFTDTFNELVGPIKVKDIENNLYLIYLNDQDTISLPIFNEKVVTDEKISPEVREELSLLAKELFHFLIPALDENFEKAFKIVFVNEKSTLLNNLSSNIDEINKTIIEQEPLYKVLSDQQKKIMVLRHVGCFTTSEISRILDVPLTVVLYEIQKASEKLRDLGLLNKTFEKE